MNFWESHLTPSHSIPKEKNPLLNQDQDPPSPSMMLVSLTPGASKNLGIKLVIGEIIIWQENKAKMHFGGL